MKKFKNTVLVALMVLAGGSQVFASESTVVSGKTIESEIKEIRMAQKKAESDLKALSDPTFIRLQSYDSRKREGIKLIYVQRLLSLSEKLKVLEDNQQEKIKKGSKDSKQKIEVLNQGTSEKETKVLKKRSLMIPVVCVVGCVLFYCIRHPDMFKNIGNIFFKWWGSKS